MKRPSTLPCPKDDYVGAFIATIEGETVVAVPIGLTARQVDLIRQGEVQVWFEERPTSRPGKP